jgi:4-amino-4-deoxy-L-arabinose transferase-like glycosyltransferase
MLYRATAVMQLQLMMSVLACACVCVWWNALMDQMERNSGSSNTQPGYQSLWQFAIEPAGAVVPDGSSLSDIAFEMVQQSGGRPMLPYSLQQRYRDQLNQQGPEALRNQSSSNNSDGLPYNRDRGLHDG